MDSILVFDDFKHCFRELDTSNYNDDLVVGSVFFTRDAINVIEKYYRIIGYIICDDKGVYYPIDVRKNDIAILEGTYNCIEDELKKELVPYNIKIEPAEVWSPFFFRWQFMCDWNVFETCGDFINIASKIIGNERLMKKIIDDKIDYVLPVNYKELSQMVRGLNKLFGVEYLKCFYHYNLLRHHLMPENQLIEVLLIQLMYLVAYSSILVFQFPIQTNKVYLFPNYTCSPSILFKT